MLRKVISTAVFIAVSAGSAYGASFNFAQEADNFYFANGFEGNWQQVTGGSLSDSGVTVTASATWDNPSDNPDVGPVAADPFFDSSKPTEVDSEGNAIEGSGKLAGLGVCHSGFTDSDAAKFSGFGGGYSECASGSPGGFPGDDNLTLSEVLKLVFNKDVQITSLIVRDHAHNLISNTPALLINGNTYNATNGIVDLTGLAFSTMFTFETLAGGIPQIYLTEMSVEVVPLPASALLLIGGMGGLAALRRFKRKSA